MAHVGSMLSRSHRVRCLLEESLTVPRVCLPWQLKAVGDSAKARSQLHNEGDERAVICWRPSVTASLFCCRSSYITPCKCLSDIKHRARNTENFAKHQHLSGCIIFTALMISCYCNTALFHVTIRPGFSGQSRFSTTCPGKITVLSGRPLVPFLALCPGFVPHSYFTCFLCPSAAHLLPK